MAWLFKFKGSDNWFIGYRLHGKQVSRTTRTSDKKEAARQLKNVEVMLGAHAGGDAVDDLYRALKSQGTARQWTLKAEVDDWLTEAAGTTAPGTTARYRSVAKGFLGYLNADETGPMLVKVGTDALRQYLAHVLAKTSPSTANYVRTILRFFFHRAIVNRRLEVDPMLPIKPFALPTNQARRRPFTAAEVSKLYAAADGFWRYAIAMGFFTGLRLGDICCATVGAFNLTTGVLSLETAKTGKRVEIPLPPAVLRLVRERVDELPIARVETPLWREYAEMTSGRRSNEFHDLLVRCGLVAARHRNPAGGGRDVTRQTTTVSFHSLRHSCVSLLKATGASQSIAKGIVGHKSDTVSDHYTSLPVESLREAIGRLPDITAA